MTARPYPLLETPRLRLFLAGPEYAAPMVDYYRRNREHLARWEPRRAEEFFTEAWWRRQLEANRREFRQDRGARMVIVPREEGAGGGGAGEQVVGVANLSNLVRGAFQACHLGYSIDREHQGRGSMYEALEALIRYAFEELRLHRVMANYQPENERSAHLLERLGFVREGFARSYLSIDGEWRDHVLTALINPAHRS